MCPKSSVKSLPVLLTAALALFWPSILQRCPLRSLPPPSVPNAAEESNPPPLKLLPQAQVTRYSNQWWYTLLSLHPLRAAASPLLSTCPACLPAASIFEQPHRLAHLLLALSYLTLPLPRPSVTALVPSPPLSTPRAQPFHIHLVYVSHLHCPVLLSSPPFLESSFSQAPFPLSLSRFGSVR